MFEGTVSQSHKLLLEAAIEAGRAKDLFPDPNHLMHALTEEFGEVVKAAMDIYHRKMENLVSKEALSRKQEYYKELEKEIIQLMAMCIRLYEEGDPAINLEPICPPSKGAIKFKGMESLVW